MDWKIICDDKKIVDQCTKNLTEIWTRLIRALSQSFWAGYSPNVLQWENNAVDKKLEITKIKDLLPEEASVNWKQVEGWAPPGNIKPKMKIYDGINQIGAPYPIPVENSLWYPLLMENGNYYGRRLLRAAYVPYFFSQLMHLFSNRYFERFGEPVPVARAPYEDSIVVPGANGTDKAVKGTTLMAEVLQSLRNRSTVVLPSSKVLDGAGNPTQHNEYEIEYLESQMRGADFERYMTRLDEEISLGLFTPLLVLRTADVGSYNLGVTHMSVYNNMLNAIAGDMAEYINKYVLWPITKYNFSENAPKPRIAFRKLGKDSAETMRAVMQALIQGDKAEPDLEELAQITGLTLKKMRAVTAKTDAAAAAIDGGADPNADPGNPPAPKGDAAATAKDKTGAATKNRGSAVTRTASEIKARIADQASAAFRKGNFGNGFTPSLGYKNRMEQSFLEDGFAYPIAAAKMFYEQMDQWLEVVMSLGPEEFSSAEEFSQLFASAVDAKLERLTDAT
jgi:hypothetical protein